MPAHHTELLLALAALGPGALVGVRGHHTLIGVAMIPRGEVGLTSGGLDPGLFSAILLMVMVTTFVAPPWLAFLTRNKG